MLIDLHLHSTYSDGTKSVDEIFNIMNENNIRLFSITDHDNLEGQKKAINFAMKKGLNYIAGVEISCKFSGGIMDILGYNIDCDMEDLNEFLKKLVKHRNERNKLIIKKLNELGMEINMEEVFNESGGTVIGRPHISRALLKKGYVKSIQDAFEMYIGEGKAAYVSKNRYEPEEVIFHIRKAGGIAVLAHPLSLNLEYGALKNKIGELVDAGLQGIEVFYKAYSNEEQEKLLTIAKDFHLLITGGSDYHGDNKPDIEPGTEIHEEFLKDFLEELNLQKLLSQS